jgi:hypothetical protein
LEDREEIPLLNSGSYFSNLFQFNRWVGQLKQEGPLALLLMQPATEKRTKVYDTLPTLSASGGNIHANFNSLSFSPS